MNYKEITDSETLMIHISQLKADRTAHEEALNRTFNELKQLILNPVLLVSDVRFDQQEIKRDLMNLSKNILNMGTDFIIEQSFGRRQNFRSFLTSIMVEIVSTPLISRNITKLFSGIDKHIFGKNESID